MRRILGAVAVLALAAACGVNAASVQTSGVNGTRDFDVGAFQSIDAAGAHNVVVTVGGAPSVRAEGDTALLERLDIRVENGRLIIGTQSGWTMSRGSGRLTIRVTAPSLEAAELAGSGNMTISPFQTARFSGDVAGSGNLILGGVQAERATFSIAGSGTVRALGTAREGSVEIAGSGDADLAGLRLEEADVSIAGSGNARLLATRAASVAIMGSGNVDLTGGAECRVTKMGSGNVRCS